MRTGFRLVPNRIRCWESVKAKPSVSLKCGAFLNCLNNYQFLKEESSIRVLEKAATTSFCGLRDHPITFMPTSEQDVIFCVVHWLIVLFYVVLVCKCVLPPGDHPIAVNKYYYYYYRYIKGIRHTNLHNMHSELCRFNCSSSNKDGSNISAYHTFWA